jgi:Uma2 family endonuclease
MTTVAHETKTREHHGEQLVGDHFVLHGTSWGFYETVLRETREQRIFVTYDQGELELMSPSHLHEAYKRIVGRMIDVYCEVMGVEMSGGGSTTLKREDLGRGLEPDECYYIQHAAAVRELRDLELPKDPPPDLVVEIDYKHRTLDREGIYAALGVPEVWRFDLEKLEFLKLAGGKYERVEGSVALGGLPRGEVERFVKMRATKGETEVIRAWREWVGARRGK